MASRSKLKKYNEKSTSQLQTKKLLKSVSVENFENKETGEIEQVGRFVLEDKDFNFEKIWISHLLQSMEALGSKKLKVAMFLLSVKDGENFVNLTYEEMVEHTGISRQTITDTIKILIGENFMKKIRNSKYQINPDLAFKGGNKKRMNVLITYDKSKPTEETKIAENPDTVVITEKPEKPEMVDIKDL